MLSAVTAPRHATVSYDLDRGPTVPETRERSDRWRAPDDDLFMSARPYNQRLVTLNKHQSLTPTQAERHHRYAQEGFGEAEHTGTATLAATLHTRITSSGDSEK